MVISKMFHGKNFCENLKRKDCGEEEEDKTGFEFVNADASSLSVSDVISVCLPVNVLFVDQQITFFYGNVTTSLINSI